jgi:hypothetical protein
MHFIDYLCILSIIFKIRFYFCGVKSNENKKQTPTVMKTTLFLTFKRLTLLVALLVTTLVLTQTRTEIINITGSGTFTVPPGVTSVTIETWGAGGGGGSSNNSSTNGGTGGGGGAYARGTHTVTPNSTYFYFVGSGGAGAPANSTATAGNGENSWFNATGVNSAPTTNTTGTLGNGGSRGNNNTTTAPTNRGLASSSLGNLMTSNGNNGAAGSDSGGGNGGSGSFGGGAGGTGSTDNNGNDGDIPGGGGGGSNDNASHRGGNGGNGQIRITYAAPTLVVIGNGNTITNGDTTPAIADHTFYGSIDIANGTFSRTYTIQNTASQAGLTISGLTITGVNAGDFSVTATPNAL